MLRHHLDCDHAGGIHVRRFSHVSAGLSCVLLSLAVLVLVPSLLDLSSAIEPPQAPSLNQLINQYLDYPDGAQAESVLVEILRRPETDVHSVEDGLLNGRYYSDQPIGTQNGLPISVRGRVYRYGLYVPAGYRPAQVYGLVLCLHGAGFTGDAYLERWQSRLDERYIVACPTMPQGNWWTREAADVVLATLRDVQARYRIDADRIFLTGMSNGGIGVYLIGSHYAPIFAGLAPMASGLDDVLLPFLANLRQTPVYIIHGLYDQVMPVELSRTIAHELNRLGYSFVYREHDRTHPVAGGHYFPREELPALVDWFDGQRRQRFSKRVTVVRDATHLLPFSWVRIDATNRIAAFSDNLVDRRDDDIKRRHYASLDAEIVGPNRIEVRTKLVQRYTLFFNHELIDFSQPITVLTNGQVSYEGPVTASRETLLREARHRGDRTLLFPAMLTISVTSTP